MKLIALPAVFCFGLGLAAGAAAGEPATANDACSLHKWGINRALGLMSDSSTPVVAGPDAVWTRASASAFFLRLSPLSRTGMLKAMDGAAADPQSLAGAVRLSGLLGGEYQISLSKPAEIEISQNGRIVEPKKSSNAAQCKIAKSVRVELKRGDAEVKINDVGAAQIGVVVERRPDQPKLHGPRN